MGKENRFRIIKKIINSPIGRIVELGLIYGGTAACAPGELQNPTSPDSTPDPATPIETPFSSEITPDVCGPNDRELFLSVEGGVPTDRFTITKETPLRTAANINAPIVDVLQPGDKAKIECVKTPNGPQGSGKWLGISKLDKDGLYIKTVGEDGKPLFMPYSLEEIKYIKALTPTVTPTKEPAPTSTREPIIVPTSVKEPTAVPIPRPTVAETPQSAPTREVFTAFPKEIVLGGGKIVIKNMGTMYGIDGAYWGWKGPNGEYCPDRCQPGDTLIFDKVNMRMNNLGYIENIIIQNNPQNSLILIVNDKVEQFPSLEKAKMITGEFFGWAQKIGNVIEVHLAPIPNFNLQDGIQKDHLRRVINIIIVGNYLAGNDEELLNFVRKKLSEPLESLYLPIKLDMVAGAK